MINSNQGHHKRSSKISLNDFELLKLLGYGTYGRVFLAKKKDTGKIYAIKVLDKKNISKHKQTDLTKLEKKILKSIKSRFLIKLYYAFQSNTKLFLVIEYCPGGELYFYLKILRNFHEKTVKFYTMNILLGLKALHNNDIVYRDLKPENLLIDFRGYIKLADFGLAKENVKDVTGASTLCGTAEYLAPEILLGQIYGKCCDFWSLGCIIFEMLECKPPFYDQNRKI